MITKIIQIGTSLGVIIPKKLLEDMGLAVGDEIEITVTKI
ncbi:MAG: AbrB/MazE/SpoVT family DNA-binding domain-containing protein [Patescibacteria group bacterium]|nr:AbrB/MazE/SpoVT family DNA-binding domain-containing protein [Patescibacteria group bacterium]